MEVNKFKFTHPLNKALAERYEREARFFGDKDAKTDMVSAKRLATQILNTLNDSRFSSVLESAQLKALRQAAHAMTALSEDLANVAAWARAYCVHCEAERAFESDTRCDDFSAERWQSDQDVVDEAADLVEYVQKGEQFKGWIETRSSRQGGRVVEMGYVEGRQIDHLKSLGSKYHSGEVGTLPLIASERRHVAAAVIDFLRHSKPGGNKDYEEWRTKRREARASMKEVVAGCSKPKTANVHTS